MQNSGVWYILEIKPRQEKVAKISVEQLGVEVYLPLYCKTVKKNKEKLKVIKPLFAGYIFARFDLKNQYKRVVYAKGVKKILSGSDFVWYLENAEIEKIKEREENGVVILKKKEKHFKKGDRVVIDEGNLDGWEGIFDEELPDKKRVTLLLTSMGFSGKITVPKDVLIKKN